MIMRAGFAFLLLCAAVPLFSQDWYRSNASGMALERTATKSMALRSQWALSVEKKEEKDIPKTIRPYFQTTFTTELRVLYERGKPARNQWLFRDTRNSIRLNASLYPEGQRPPGNDTIAGRLPFIELYSEEDLMTEFHQITFSGDRYLTLYTYRERQLAAAETRFRGKTVWKDSFSYTRDAKLRKIERVFTNAAEVPVSLRFPPPGPFIDPDSPYDAVFMGGALRAVYDLRASRIEYTTDELGKVLAEVHFDGAGKEIAVVNNDWFDDRVVSVHWRAGSEWGSTEFEYSDSGERISEKNFREDVLERSVTRVGNQDIEELYMYGRTILRAVWENGRKISEERF